MQTITFMRQDDATYKYIGRVEWRPDTYEIVKDKLVEVEISDDQFSMISDFGCVATYVDGQVQIQESEKYINRYAIQRAGAYPSMLEYIDAQVKKASDDPIIREEGEAQEQAYISSCLAVKNQYPKPTE